MGAQHQQTGVGRTIKSAGIKVLLGHCVALYLMLVRCLRAGCIRVQSLSKFTGEVRDLKKSATTEAQI